MKLLPIHILLFFPLWSASQMPGDAIFSGEQLIHEIRITLPMQSWFDTLSANYELSELTGQNIYAAGVLEFDGVILNEAGFKFKGNSSYNNPGIKKSWKISTEEFIPGNEIDGLNEFNLNNCFKDPSFLREKLCLDFLNHYNLPAPRCVYADVYVNEEYFGFYTLVEEVDKKMLQTRFGNSEDNLYKGDPHGDLQWAGATPQNYITKYEKKTNESVNDWSDLIHFIDVINNSSDLDFVDSLDQVFNTSEYVKSWAATQMFCNFDSYTGSGHNYFVYHNASTGRFEWINWDVNEAFGSFNFNNSITNMITVPLDYVPLPPNNRPLHVRMKDEPTYWSQLQNFICTAVNEYFNPAYMNPLIDSLHNAIQDHVYADPNKLYSNLQFDQNTDQQVMGILGLKPFVAQRSENLLTQLDESACDMVFTKEIENDDMFVYPNPFSDELMIKLPENTSSNWSVCLSDAAGRTIYPQTSKLNGKNLVHTRQLTPGVYTVKAVSENGDIFTTKVICVR